jgi:hypothetical protein
MVSVPIYLQEEIYPVPFVGDPILAQEHRQWLSAYDRQHLRNWEKLLNDDSEAGMCEAAVRRLLELNGNRVQPNAGLASSPDFKCTKSGQVFFVEVTCISVEKATQETGMSNLPSRTGELETYSLLNDALWGACKHKTLQCVGLAGPASVAVGTFHFNASCLCFLDVELEGLLTGEQRITRDIDTRTGDPVGDTYLSTAFRSAAFFRPDKNTGMAHARCPVSAMLLCGFGSNPPHVRGILHPAPVHGFDRGLLPRVEFCRLREGWESGQLSTEWI